MAEIQGKRLTSGPKMPKNVQFWVNEKWFTFENLFSSNFMQKSEKTNE